jgi:hypothetical protein
VTRTGESGHEVLPEQLDLVAALLSPESPRRVVGDQSLHDNVIKHAQYLRERWSILFKAAAREPRAPAKQEQ